MIFYWLLCVYVVNMHIMSSSLVYLQTHNVESLGHLFLRFIRLPLLVCLPIGSSVMWFYLVRSTKSLNGTRSIDLCAENLRRIFTTILNVCKMFFVINRSKYFCFAIETVMKFVKRPSWKHDTSLDFINRRMNKFFWEEKNSIVLRILWHFHFAYILVLFRFFDKI